MLRELRSEVSGGGGALNAKEGQRVAVRVWGHIPTVCTMQITWVQRGEDGANRAGSELVSYGSGLDDEEGVGCKYPRHLGYNCPSPCYTYDRQCLLFYCCFMLPVVVRLV